MTARRARSLMAATALGGSLAVPAPGLSAGGPGRAARQIHSAAIAAPDIPAPPVSPAGVLPASSSLDLAGAISHSVAPVLSRTSAAHAAIIREI